MVNFIEDVIYWWPWLNFFSEIYLLQVLLVYVAYLLFSALNVYYVLIYLFLEIFLFGCFISIIQMELFTGFLWVVECTVIFIALILLFYLNVEGSQVRLNLQVYRLYFVFILFILFYLFNGFLLNGNFENYNIQLFNNLDLWEDYYEALHNINLNDFRALSIGYYSINSVEFIVIGLILLIGSVVCVNLNKIQKSIRILKYSKYLSIFKKMKGFLNFTFIRKQNLVKQNANLASVRIFKKK